MKQKSKLWLVVLAVLSCAAPAVAIETVLDPVVVTASRIEEPLSDVSASVAVVTAEEIASRGVTRLDEVLQDVVGLHVVSSGPDGSLASASIRGSEASHVLVMIDGVRLNSPQNGQLDLSQLPVSLNEIDRIEVLRGGASALYGSNALGGVIQIFTKAPEETAGNRVSVTVGRHESNSIEASTARKVGALRYRLGAELKGSDGYRDNSDYDQYTVNGLIGYSPKDDADLELSVYHLDYDSGIPGSASAPFPAAEQKDNKTIISLKGEGQAGPVKLTTRALYEHHRNDYENPTYGEADTHKVDTYGGEVQAETGPEGHLFLFGGDYYRDKIDSTNIGDQALEHGALFGQYQLELTPALTLLLGLRYDIHSEFDNEWSPRAALLANLSDTTRLRLSATKAFRAPTLNDLFWSDAWGNVGNPDLSPETAWEYEVALDQAIGQRGRFTVAGFLRDAKDLIQWQATGANWWDPWTPMNVGEARIWGVEFDGRYDVCEHATIGGNYTYLNPKNSETDEYLRNNARHEAHAFVVLKPFAETTLRLDGRYLRYYEQPARPNKDYFVADLSLSRAIMLGDVLVDATFSVKNLLNREYEARPDSPMPPRQWFFEVAAHF